MDGPLQQGGIETEKENGNKHFQTYVRGRAEIEKGTEFVQHGGTRQNASWKSCRTRNKTTKPR